MHEKNFLSEFIVKKMKQIEKHILKITIGLTSKLRDNDLASGNLLEH